MSMPGQAQTPTPLCLSSLSLPTVTQATADNRLGKVGAGGVATLPDTFVAPVTLVCQTNCSAHTQSVMPRYSLWGAARMPSSNWLQQATVREQLLLPHPFAKYERHQQRRVVDAAASHNTPLHPNPNVAPATPPAWTVECPQPDTVSLYLSVRLCICLSVHLICCPLVAASCCSSYFQQI